MTQLTPYVIELIVALLAIVGALLVIFEFRRRKQWVFVAFFSLLGLAPLWFGAAHLRLLAVGNPDWVLNRWISFGVRIPLVACLYVLAWRLRRNNAVKPLD